MKGTKEPLAPKTQNRTNSVNHLTIHVELWLNWGHWLTVMEILVKLGVVWVIVHFSLGQGLTTEETLALIALSCHAIWPDRKDR